MSEATPDLPATAVVDPDLVAGQAVGEYQVESKIGQGGFGAVFKAVHPLIGKVVAIKVLARRFSVDPDMLSRFVAEARAVNQIRHHNIIDIFSFGQLEDGRHYYVMEYLDGMALDALIERDRRIAPADALPILRAIARALDAAHAKGIAHRDLKPENVFLATDPDGGWFPKLLDFGIAKLMAPEDGLKHKTGTGVPLGTPYYMSPEQCRGRDVDHRTDYYAFGIVAYRMLCGMFPFDGDDYMSILMKQIGEQAAPPSSHAPELPVGVDDAVAWLMQKDPSQRPPNLITAVRALESAFDGTGIVVARGPMSAAWDVTTGDPGKTATPWPPKRSSDVLPSTPATPLAVSSLQDAPVKSKAPLVIGLVVAAALVGGVVFVVLSSSGGNGSHPTQTAATSPTPASPPAPTPPPPAAAVQTPPAVAVPAPAIAPTISLDITGAPAGSEVVLADHVIGSAPGSVVLDRGTAAVALVIRHAGYVPIAKRVVPDHDDKLDATLHRKVAPTATAPKPATGVDSHDIENPFHH